MKKLILLVSILFLGLAIKAIPVFYYYAYNPTTGVICGGQNGCANINVSICDSLCLYYENVKDYGAVSMITSNGSQSFTIPYGQTNCVWFKPTALGNTQIGWNNTSAPFGFTTIYNINVVQGNCINTSNCDVLYDGFDAASLWTHPSTPFTCTSDFNDINITAGKFNFNAANDNHFNYMYRTGLSINNSAWSADVDFISNQATNKPTSHTVLSINGGTLPFFYDPYQTCFGSTTNICSYPGIAPCQISNQEGINVSFNSSIYSFPNIYAFTVYINSGGSFTSVATIPNVPRVGNYYIRLERLNAQLGRLNIYSDLSRTTHIAGSPVCFTIPTTVDNLNTVQLGCNESGFKIRVLTGTLDNLCIKNKVPVDMPTITGNTTICKGQCTTLTASGGVSYSWSTGATATSITVCPTATTTYNATITLASGCTVVVPVTVVVKPTYSINVYDTICEGTTMQLPNGTTVTAGVYTIVYHTVNNCDSIVNYTIVAKPCCTKPSIDTFSINCESLCLTVHCFPCFQNPKVYIDNVPVSFTVTNDSIYCINISNLDCKEHTYKLKYSDCNGVSYVKTKVLTKPTYCCCVPTLSISDTCATCFKINACDDCIKNPMYVSSNNPISTPLTVNADGTFCLDLKGCGQKWVKIKYRNCKGEIIVLTQTFTKPEKCCCKPCTIKAAFTYNQTTHVFTDASTKGTCNTQTAWSWNFGDGSTSSLQNPTHTYTSNGTYKVCLYVFAKDAQGITCCDVICKDIVVTNVHQDCNINPAFTVIKTTLPSGKTKLDFISTTTTSPAGTVIYSWNYGDGSTTTDTLTTTSTTTSYTYNSCFSCNAYACVTITLITPGGQVCKKDTCVVTYIGKLKNPVVLDTLISLPNFPLPKTTAFPNPSKQSITITWSDFKGDKKIEIADMLGNVLYSSQIDIVEKGTSVLDVSSYATGTYIYTISSSSGTRVSDKFMVLK